MQDMTIKELGEMLNKRKTQGAKLQWRPSETAEWIDETDEASILTMIANCIYNDYSVRVKPINIHMPARAIPMPETEAPSTGTMFYLPSVCSVDYFLDFTWDSSFKELLERGIVYLNKYSAIEAAKAMLPFKVPQEKKGVQDA
jgi:hypothetical protein